MRFDAIIFDLDGPLLNGKQRHYECYKDILQELNCDFLDINTYWQMKRERRNRHEQLAATAAEKHYDKFLKLWLERIETTHYLAFDVLQEDALDQLTRLRQTQTKLILATLRQNVLNLHQQLTALNIGHFFHNIVAVDSQKAIDKASAVRELLTDIPNDRCLWVGDTEIDSQSAITLKIPLALVSNGLRTREYLASLSPHYLGENLSEVLALTRK